MLEQEAGVDDVVCAVGLQLDDVAVHELHVRDGQPTTLLSDEVELDLVGVEAHDRPGGADQCGQEEADIARAATDVEATHPRTDADQAEQRLSALAPHPRQDTKALEARASAGDHVFVGHRTPRPSG